MTKRERDDERGPLEPVGSHPHPEGEIAPQEWAILNSGAKVYSADGEQYGTVRESMELYLMLKIPDGALSDSEVYLPRDLIDRVEGDEVHLSRSFAELEELDLKTPPALRH